MTQGWATSRFFTYYRARLGDSSDLTELAFVGVLSPLPDVGEIITIGNEKKYDTYRVIRRDWNLNTHSEIMSATIYVEPSSATQ